MLAGAKVLKTSPATCQSVHEQEHGVGKRSQIPTQAFQYGLWAFPVMSTVTENTHPKLNSVPFLPQTFSSALISVTMQFPKKRSLY